MSKTLEPGARVRAKQTCRSGWDTRVETGALGRLGTDPDDGEPLVMWDTGLVSEFDGETDLNEWLEVVQ